MSNYNQPIAINGQPFTPGAVYEMQTSIVSDNQQKYDSVNDQFFFNSMVRLAGSFNNNVDLSIYCYIQNQMVSQNQAHITLTKRIKSDIVGILKRTNVVAENQNPVAIVNHSIKRMYHNDILRYIGDGEFVLNPNYFISKNPLAVNHVIDLWEKTPIYVKGPSKRGSTGRPRKSND